MTPQEICKFIESHRFSLSSEAKAQDEFFEEMRRNDVNIEREVILGAADRIDFMHGDIGIEFKIKGRRREIYRQCERYCGYDRVGTLILASRMSMGTLAQINGTPVYVARLGSWM